MIRKENETQSIEVIKDIICNKCGNSCQVKHGFEFADLKVHWGYYSNNRDMELHEAHLCQSCWERIIADFKYSDLIADNVL